MDSWPLFLLLAPKTCQFLHVAYANLSLDSSAQYSTSWEAKNCSCVLFTTARLPCPHPLEVGLLQGDDPRILVDDRWDFPAGQPVGAEVVTLEPTIQHSSDESPVIIKDHIQKTVNALQHLADKIENHEGPFPPGTDHSLTKIDEAVNGSETLLPSYSGPTMMLPPGNSAGLRIRRIQPGPHEDLAPTPP